MPLWTLLVWLILGGLAGILAGNIMKAGRPYGLIGDIILGILGAVAGGWVLGLFGFGVNGIVASFITAVLGAMLLIWIVRKIKKV